MRFAPTFSLVCATACVPPCPDAQPATEAEIYVTSFCMFIGLMLNTFVIGSMASALSSADSKKAISRGKIETIGAYLLIHNVPHEVSARILEFYECVIYPIPTASSLGLPTTAP